VFHGEPDVWRQEVCHDRGGHVPSRRVRWVQESVWTERDRAFAVALELHERSLCPGCGNPVDEAWSPDAYDAHQAEPISCGPCRAIERGRHLYDESVRNGGKARDFGLHWSAHRHGETPLSQRLRDASRKDDL